MPISRVVNQRELRNELAAVMDAVEHGETIVVTRNGTPVAELRPLRRRTFLPTADLKRAFAGCPPTEHSAMRSKMDVLLGEERITIGPA